MPNSFCNLLSNGYSFTTNPKNNQLMAGPCCLHTKKIVVTDNLKDQHRLQFGSITDWVQECKECHLLEVSGQQSLRQTGPDWCLPDLLPQSAAMIDINLDKECNAACVTCGEFSSTFWARENQKFHKIKKDNNFDKKIVSDHIQTILSTVDLDYLTYIKFFGGEPLFTDSHVQFLEKIPNPENVTVHYTTNASIFPTSRVLNIWKKFKCIIFAASIDGIDKQFDYIRWPLTWNKVSHNLIKIKEARISNLLFRIEFTANFLNVFYYDRLDEWVRKNLPSNEFGDPIETNIHYCTNSPFDFARMPNDIKDLIKQKYNTDHILHKMVSNFKFDSNLNEFWKFVDKWDPWRKLKWQDSFPDLVPYLPAPV